MQGVGLERRTAKISPWIASFSSTNVDCCLPEVSLKFAFQVRFPGTTFLYHFSLAQCLPQGLGKAAQLPGHPLRSPLFVHLRTALEGNTADLALSGLVLHSGTLKVMGGAVPCWTPPPWEGKVVSTIY